MSKRERNGCLAGLASLCAFNVLGQKIIGLCETQLYTFVSDRLIMVIERGIGSYGRYLIQSFFFVLNRIDTIQVIELYT